MSRNIVHEGGPSDVIPWTNGTGSAVAAGAVVVLKHTIGIALVDIPNGAVGSVAIGGVISGVAKVNTTAWLQGEKLLWDVSAAKFDNSAATPATGDIMGGAIAWLAAGSSDTTGSIKLTPGNTTLT
jgi:predicted RecA/RadA family phage recombinase